MNECLSLNQNTLLQCETEEFIAVSAKVGFKGVELRQTKLKDFLYRKPFKEIRDLLKKYKISVVSINALEDFSLVPKSNLSLLEEECEFMGKLCQMAECSTVVVCPTKFLDKDDVVMSSDEIVNTTINRLQFIGEIFQKYDVQIGFEPIGFPEYTVKDLNLAQQIVEKCKTKSLSYVIDIYNLYRASVKPIEIKQLTYPVSVVHINDSENKQLSDLHVLNNRVFPGEGICDAAEWVKTLKQNGYRGYYSLELFNKNIWDMNPEKGAQLCYDKSIFFLNNL